jgi:hypothetical protein
MKFLRKNRAIGKRGGVWKVDFHRDIICVWPLISMLIFKYCYYSNKAYIKIFFFRYGVHGAFLGRKFDMKERISTVSWDRFGTPPRFKKCNITKNFFLLILSHCGSKFCRKCVKSLVKMVNFFRKSWKICTMGRFLKKSYNDFFFNLHFWNVGKVPNNTQSRDILKYELSKFRLKNSPWTMTWFYDTIWIYVRLRPKHIIQLLYWHTLFE